ncbi:MAG: hypothetical protein ACOYL6_08895 [Bacteriovoracaceae bacterium]
MLFFLFLISQFTIAGLPDEFKKTIVCPNEVERITTDWNAKNEWQKFLIGMNDRGIKVSTNELGRWITVVPSSKEVTTISNITSSVVTEVQIKANCSRKINLIKNPKIFAQNEITDQVVKEFVKNNTQGMIYIWSPHMPLSVTGLPGLKKAAADQKIPILFVMDNSASEALVKKYLKSGSITMEQTRKLASMELYQQDATLHYPSLLIFKKGQFVLPTHFGNRTEQEYSEIIKSKLK